jgi:hypothetical protein
MKCEVVYNNMEDSFGHNTQNLIDVNFFCIFQEKIVEVDNFMAWAIDEVYMLHAKIYKYW